MSKSSPSSPFKYNKIKKKISNLDKECQLNNQILKLHNWKHDVGIPAVNENEKLRSIIKNLKQKQTENESHVYALQQENKALKIQLDTFHEEHDKWIEERKDLLQQLDDVSHERNTSMMEEENWAMSIQQTYRNMDKLKVRHVRSNSDLTQSRKTVADLLEEIQVIEAKYNEYKLLSNKQINDIKLLNTKLNKTNDQLIEMQTKYDDVYDKYINEKEKTQKVLNDIMTNRLKDVESYRRKSNSPVVPISFNPTRSVHSSVSTTGALSVGVRSPVSPNNRKRRSASFDDIYTHDKLLLYHIDISNANTISCASYDVNEGDEKEISNTTNTNDNGFIIIDEFTNKEFYQLKIKYDELLLKYNQLKLDTTNDGIDDDNNIIDLLMKEKQKQALIADEKIYCGFMRWFS